MKSVGLHRALCRGALVLGLVVSLGACGGGASDDGTQTLTTTPVAAQARPGDVRLEAALAKGAALNSGELQAAEQGLLAPAPGTKAAGDTRVAVYRFFNTATSAHFYTASAEERDRIIQTLPVLQFEGPAFHASASAATALSPVYRFYNSATGVHFYTISEAEKDHIIATLPQFGFEGVAYHASKVAGENMLKPLFRFYVPSKGFHFYTASAAEADNIRSSLPAYRYEGIAYHVLLSPTEPAPGKIYKGLAAPTTRTAAETQADAEGATGYTYFTDFYFSNLTQLGAVYFNDLAQPRTFQHKVLSTAVSSAASKVTALNTQGGLGYGYQGDVLFSGSGLQAYARHTKPTPGSGNMSYLAQAMPATSDGFLNLLNQQGAAGYRYLNQVSYAGTTSVLFERSSQRPGPFTYRLLANSTTTASFEAQANTQGAEGYAFKGALVFGGSILDLYAKDGGKYAVYSYKTVAFNPADSMATVIAGLNAEGASGHYWFGTYYFGGAPYAIHYKGNYVCHPLGGCATPSGL